MRQTLNQLSPSRRSDPQRTHCAGDTGGHASGLPVQLRPDIAQDLGSPNGCRNDVLSSPMIIRPVPETLPHLLSLVLFLFFSGTRNQTQDLVLARLELMLLSYIPGPIPICWVAGMVAWTVALVPLQCQGYHG